MNKPLQPDHRTRVAADRRAKTRNRLIQSALQVFACKGVDASVIDDVIEAAGVSRGTFYNYFQSNRDLLLAVNDQLRSELITLIEKEVCEIPDPAERISTGLGLFIQVARDNPLLARFIAQVGLEASGPGRLVCKSLTDDLQHAIQLGRFQECPLHIALDLMEGAALFAIYRISLGGISDTHAPQVISTILRGFGLESQEAANLAAKPLPKLDVRATCSLMNSAAKPELAS